MRLDQHPSGKSCSTCEREFTVSDTFITRVRDGATFCPSCDPPPFPCAVCGAHIAHSANATIRRPDGAVLHRGCMVAA